MPTARRTAAGPALRVAAGLAALALVPWAYLAGQVTSAGPAAAAVPASFPLTGDGYGHGVGMSQYGAKAQADAGRTVAQILASYYAGTALTSLPDSSDLRVQVLAGASSVTAKTAAVTTGGGAFTVTAGGLTLSGTASSAIRLVPSSTNVTVTVTTGTTSTSATGPLADIRWAGTRWLSGTATLLDVTGAGGRYRHGHVEVSTLSGRLNVVNVLRLHDEYLFGIAEMPSSWAAEALKAQAVAARTIAIAGLNGGVKASCGCHLYDEVSSQEFTGWSKENEGTGGQWGTRWKAAVTGTAPTSTTGQVLTSGGRLITAYYFSSSGGRTENSEDVWTAALSYARSMPDPWSLTAANPYYGWTRTISQAAMASAFGLPDVARLNVSARTAGESVDVAVGTSSSGATSKLSGQTFRSRLGLPSAWLRRPVTRLSGADRYATSVAVARALPASTTAVIVSGLDDHLIDGVAAAPLAGALGAPVLLVGSGLGSTVRAELVARGVRSAVVVGGPGSVPDAVVTSLQGLGISVSRAAGADRYETAAAVARRMPRAPVAALVAAGDTASLADALAGAAVGAASGRPVLLTRGTVVPEATLAAVRDLGITAASCIGGPEVLSEAVRLALPRCARQAGADRYATAATLVGAFTPIVTTSNLTVAGGSDVNAIDALVAAGLRHPLVYVGSDVPAAVATLVRSQIYVSSMTVVGGPSAVPETAVAQLRRL
jgi:SpoIID/LytB domain protein